MQGIWNVTQRVHTGREPLPWSMVVRFQNCCYLRLCVSPKVSNLDDTSTSFPSYPQATSHYAHTSVHCSLRLQRSEGTWPATCSLLLTEAGPSGSYAEQRGWGWVDAKGSTVGFCRFTTSWENSHWRSCFVSGPVDSSGIACGTVQSVQETTVGNF